MKFSFPVEIRVKIKEIEEIKGVLKQIEDAKKDSTSIVKVSIEVEQGD